MGGLVPILNDLVPIYDEVINRDIIVGKLPNVPVDTRAFCHRLDGCYGVCLTR